MANSTPQDKGPAGPANSSASSPGNQAQPLRDRTAVVTGAGRGLGRAAALALAQAGARLALLGRTPGPLQEVARQIQAGGGTAVAIPTDVTVESQLERAAEQVSAELGGTDILINNAGEAPVGPLLQARAADMERVLRVNVVAAMTCSRVFGAQMVQKQHGRVINIASVTGLTGESNTCLYAASKGALIAFSRTLAVEWARYGVTVNAVAPGYFRTDLNAAALDDPDVGERLLKKIPLRRVGQPAELGPLLVYLSSDESAFMTGSVLVIDGGQVAR